MTRGDSRTYILAVFLAVSVSVVSLLAAMKSGLDPSPTGLAPDSPVTIRANSDTPDIEKGAPAQKAVP